MRTFRTILVPLDGSELAEQALPLAEHLAMATGAELELVRVHVPPTAWDIYADAMTAGPDVRDSAPAEGAYLEEQARRARGTGLTVNASLLEGEVAPAIARRARAVADLIVMTTHGRGPFSRLWLGSVADQLLRSLAQPMLLVRPTMEAWAVASSPPYRRILVPLDGTDGSEAALEAALALGAPDITEYVLVRVLNVPVPALAVPVPMAVETEPTELEEARAAEKLETVAAGLRVRGFKARVCVEVRGGAAEGILAAAEREAPDVIALATRAPGRVERMLLGSVADKVVRAAHEPVLVVPAK